MRIFGKPIPDLKFDDLQQLVDEKAVENLRLEFKRDIPDKDETLKKLSSFANTMGGLLLVGAEAGSRDGRIQALPGVELRSSYKQTVVQWCFDGTAPPLDVDVSDPIPLPGNNERAVLRNPHR